MSALVSEMSLLLVGLGCDPVRLQILRFCAVRERVGSREIAAEFRIALNTARGHLADLASAGLLVQHQERRDRRRWSFVWTVQPQALRDLVDDLDLLLRPE